MRVCKYRALYHILYACFGGIRIVKFVLLVFFFWIWDFREDGRKSYLEFVMEPEAAGVPISLIVFGLVLGILH